MEDVTSLSNNATRQVYLLTYSQANLANFPTRRSFIDAVLDSFAQTPSTVIHWVCAKEAHANGGTHYHVAIKLDRVQRWLRVRRYLESQYYIRVNFSSIHCNYYSAWKYVTKEDKDPLQSENHPVLTNAPRTMSASEVVHDAPDASQSEGPRKRRRKSRLSAFEVGEIALANDIKSRLQLLAFANKQKLEGKTDLAEFIFNRSKKSVDEALSTAWEMTNAEMVLERERLKRLDILEQCLQSDCVEGCNARWLHQAKDILSRNDINVETFSSAVKCLLEQGRGKYRNIIITGPTNCGKTFILQPLTHIYTAFVNPATATYAWIGVERAQVVLLNDFRWSPQVIIIYYYIAI